ncbi:MAG: VOC family protein [Ornithinimicrobium sp.]
MSLTSCYPVLMTRDVATTSAFYREHLGFEPTFDSSWYVSLRRDTFELAILDADHDTVPTAYRTTSAGILINLEVDDVDAVHQLLVVDGPLEALTPLRSEEFGQRHFILAGPDDVLIDVITEIEPTGEFAATYALTNDETAAR